jgi:hypothetical protein
MRCHLTPASCPASRGTSRSATHRHGCIRFCCRLDPAAPGGQELTGGVGLGAVFRAAGHNAVVASYSVNPHAIARAQQLIDSRQYVLDSDGAKSSPAPARRTPSWNQTPGRNTPNGTPGSATAPRPGMRSSTETSAGCTPWASSPATTGPPSGGTRISSSPPTSCCNAWTTGNPDAQPAPARQVHPAVPPSARQMKMPGQTGCPVGTQDRWGLSRDPMVR